MKTTQTQKLPIKLDAYDKKILLSMKINSRKSKKTLAKELGISHARLTYKINRLTKELIQPITLLNYPLLSIKSYLILTKEKISKQETEKILNSENIFMASKAIGEYKNIFIILTNNIQKICQEYFANYNIEIKEIISYHPDHYNPFDIKKFKIPNKQNKRIKLDKKDYKLLLELSKNPTMPILQLSEKTKINRQTINKKIKRLEESNTIMSFRYTDNTYKWGMTIYLIRIQFPLNLREKIHQHWQHDRYAAFMFETYNEFLILYQAPSYAELNNFLDNIDNIAPNIKSEVIQIQDFLELNPNPKYILELFKKLSQTKTL